MRILLQLHLRVDHPQRVIEHISQIHANQLTHNMYNAIRRIQIAAHIRKIKALAEVSSKYDVHDARVKCIFDAAECNVSRLCVTGCKSANTHTKRAACNSKVNNGRFFAELRHSFHSE